MYGWLLFRARGCEAPAPQHPEVEGSGTVRLPTQGRYERCAEGGEKAIAEIVMATHAGMTTAEFEQTVKGTGCHGKNIPKPAGLIPEMGT